MTAATKDRTNGHHQTAGREVPALPTFTFKDTGITVRLRKLSPYMGDQIGKAVRREKPAPEVPQNPVDYGDGKTAMEPNPADPDYQQALAEYEQWIAFESGQRLLRLVVEHAVDVSDEEIDQAAVAEKRAIMASIGASIDEFSDRDVYIKYVCVGTQEDMEDLMAAATRRSQPTEAAIADNVTAFRRDVSA